MWRAGRRRRQRQGFQGVVLPLRILEDNGISRTVRSVYGQDEPQVSSAAPTTTLQPTADNNDITSSCQQSADEPVPDVSRHQQKKEQEKEAWADRRDDLIQTGMKLATPPTDFCYYCEQRVTSPMLYCRDCGPLGIYCLTCFEMFHISPSLHRPLEWKGGCFQPYMKRKTLSLPCHYSCFGTIDTRSMRIFDQTGTGVTSNSLHPGVIYTEIHRQQEERLREALGERLSRVANKIIEGFVGILGKTWEEGAQTTICCAVAEEWENTTGLYFSDCVPKETSAAGMDDKAAAKLWDISEKMVGLKS